MSLLWVEAMAWWNNERDFEHEGDDEYPLRDPQETLSQRGQRYKQRVAQGHGVAPEIAQRAIQHVVGHIQQDTPFTDPASYGFSSRGRGGMDAWPAHVEHALMDPHTFRGRQPEDVSLKQPIHASQDFIRPHSVAHNLFHPGRKQPWDDKAVGDPDAHPEDYQDGDEDHRATEDEVHSRVYFLHRNNGEMHVVDGHHRVATNLLLGKGSMKGIVIHENEIPQRRRR